MAHPTFVFALGLALAATPAAATNPEPVPPTAPAGNADTRYCLRVAPLTGSLIETVRCWTRQKWADQGVDVDKEWPKEGVRVIG